MELDRPALKLGRLEGIPIDQSILVLGQSGYNFRTPNCAHPIFPPLLLRSRDL